jgi:DNA-binding PadR family transcriptional regulator
MHSYIAIAGVVILLLSLLALHSAKKDERVSELVLCMLRDATGYVSGSRLREELAAHGHHVCAPRFYSIMAKLEDQGLVARDVVDSGEWTYYAGDKS